MKKAYKHNTGVFGDDAEAYLGTLFNMHNIPSGVLMPDLVSLDGLDPRLALEVKSGKNGKFALLDNQFHYGINSAEDYVRFFGVEAENDFDDTYHSVCWDRIIPERRKRDLLFYHAFISRVDDLAAEDVDGKYDSIKIEWGDVFLAPSDLIFTGFAVIKALRERKTSKKVGLDFTPWGDVVSGLKDVVSGCLTSVGSNYKDRKNDSMHWQSFNMKDLKALWTENYGGLKRDAKLRVKAIRSLYPGDLSKLERTFINGPNGTTIYCLTHPDHDFLFDNRLRRVVNANKDKLEVLARARKRARSLLGKDYDEFRLAGLFGADSDKCLTSQEVSKLDRLSKWVPYGSRYNKVKINFTVDSLCSEIDQIREGKKKDKLEEEAIRLWGSGNTAGLEEITDDQIENVFENLGNGVVEASAFTEEDSW